MRYVNNTRETLDLPVKGEARDGVPPTDSITAGETKTVNVDPENLYVKALIAMGALTAVEASRKAKEPQ